MDIKFRRMLNIEEKLKLLFEKNLFLLYNSKTSHIQDKYIKSLFFEMIQEESELNLGELSTDQINEYLEQLEMDFYGTETSFLFEDILIDSVELEIKVRLYSNLKKAKMLRLKHTLLDASQKYFYYEELLRARLLEAFYDYHLSHSLTDEDYAKIFYKVLYSFVGLENSNDCDIHLKEWFLNSFYLEDYLAYERQMGLEYFKQELFLLRSFQVYELQNFLAQPSFSFYFASLVTLLVKLGEKETLEQFVNNFKEDKFDLILNFIQKIARKNLSLRVVK